MINNISKIKLIILAILGIGLVITYIVVYIYINNLKSKVDNLNNTVVEQYKQIEQLNKNIDLMRININSYKNTISITDDYISSINKINSDELNNKNAINNKIVNNENNSIKEWLNEKIPDNLIHIINDNTNRMCKDSI